MSLISKPASQERSCHSRYRYLVREYRRKGVDRLELERSLLRLSTKDSHRCFLKDVAVKPTGFALGHPLPDHRMTRRLWNISNLLEQRLEQLWQSSGNNMAYVPPAAYHVTLVNRSHFDCTPEADFEPMDANELRIAQKVIREICHKPLSIYFCGLILTHTGRLILPGYPCDDRFFALRQGLVDAVPSLRVNLPVTAHIKLGHLLRVPIQYDMDALFSTLHHLGFHVSGRLSFIDVYSPMARIPFHNL